MRTVLGWVVLMAFAVCGLGLMSVGLDLLWWISLDAWMRVMAVASGLGGFAFMGLLILEWRKARRAS